MDSGINIIDLHVDVLNNIFSELSMEDQINFGFAHPNLREAFLLYNRSKLNTINLDKFPFTKWDSVLSLCGHTIKSLELNGVGSIQLALNCAAKHCKSLQEIDFPIHRMDNLNEVGRRLSELTSLNNISIRNCFDEEDYIKFVIESMQDLPNLRKLYLDRFPKVALIQLGKLTQLEELYIDDKLKGSFINIAMICAPLINLRALYFEAILIDADYFQVLPQFCPLLEKLMLNSSNIIQIPYFPKLKQLKIYMYSAPIDEVLGECGHRYAKQLDTLIIHASNLDQLEPIKNRELLAQLKKITNFVMIFDIIN